MPVDTEIHLRDGLSFRRQDDGSVLIQKMDGENGPMIFEAVIDKEKWCMVIAAVSDGGASPSLVDTARILHGWKGTAKP